MIAAIKKCCFFLIVCAGLIASFTAGGQEVSRDDYARAVSFLMENINNKTAFNLFVRANWYPDSSGLWYMHYGPGNKVFNQVSFPSLEVSHLFDHQKVADALRIILNEEVQATDLPFNSVDYVNKEHIQFSVKGKIFQLNLEAHTITSVASQKEEYLFESRSPDGKWVAYSEDYNLFIKSTETGKVYQLSTRGKKNYEYGSYYGWFDKMEGENGERPQRFYVNWSPDSKWIQTSICDLRYADKMYLLDWSVDTLYRSRLLSYFRGSPGDTTMVHMIPVFYNIEQKKEIVPDLPRNTHINGISFRWSAVPGQVYAHYSERGYQKSHILKLDLKTNQLTTLITETSDTRIDNFNYWLIEAKNRLIFTSERSGWKQLYTLNLETGKIKPIGLGDYYVNTVQQIDTKKGIIYFLASGKEPGRNPYHQHLYRVTTDGKKLKLLTGEDAHHEVSFSPDGSYFFDNFSTATTPTISVLRDAGSGRILVEVSRADIKRLLAKNWRPPQVFETTGRDHKTRIYGALWKPTDFDPMKKYPLIDHSYTGPHTQMFPKSFSVTLARNNQALAELGFIVMMVDGMGTAGRSKAFHDVSYKQMGFNLTDHVLAIEQLGRQYSWIDTDKVGIFGHSAGGYDAAHAMLQFPDVYKVAVASSGDHDFRMEKAWWPEMYMGWPVDSSYHLQSSITMAGKLKGSLLLVHGGLDDNVNPSATFKLAEALVKADKEFDLLILPGQRHGYRGQHAKYFRKKRWNYFVAHLLGAEPIWDFDWEQTLSK